MPAAQENARVKKEITNDEKEEIVLKTIYGKTQKPQRKDKTPRGINITLKRFPILYS
jgi:hypothetical protein